MRLRKADLRARVNADLALRFQASGLTSFAGLELLRRYFQSIHLTERIRRHLGTAMPSTDFGVVSMILLLLTLVVTGGRRVRHLLYLDGDPLALRLCGLRRLPTPFTVGRWLARLRMRHLDGLLHLNEELVADAIRRSGVKRLTIDVDGTVVSTGLQVERARRGYNPHHRKVPSYYPITVYEAQTGQILRVRNRSGNVHDGKASIGFLRDLFRQLRGNLGTGYALECRMDGAFFRRDVLELLDRNHAEYAIKVPFFRWVGMKALIQGCRFWQPVDVTVSCFEACVLLKPWDRYVRVVVYRKRVHHETAKNFQLDLFDPADGHYEYSAVVTNKQLSGPYLWRFICGRGAHEKALGELKDGFAFDCLPTMKYAANSAWQIVSVLAFNLIRGFQVATTAERLTLLFLF
ncbi:MAG: IS1380 family transposase [Candidatus Binatia bacterium]